MVARRLSAAALMLAALLIDQLSKDWAVSVLRAHGGSLQLPGPVDLTFSLNRSNAFGLTPVLGEFTRWGLTALNLAVASAILVTIFRGRWRVFTVLGLALVAAGATGNALDRIRYGAVIDFFDASKIGFTWIFNLADASLDAGLLLLALSALTHRAQNDRRLGRAAPTDAL